MKVQQLIRVVFVCGAVVILPGCAVLGGGKSKPAPIVENATVDNQVDEARLRAMVDKRLSESQQHSTADNAALNFRKPYFYKEYVDYPDGIQGYTLEILESDSKGTPYSARISLAKKRYVTKLVKKKSQARSDDSYSESVGVETLSYEYRHGHWRETGSVFIANEQGSSPVAAASNDESAVAEKDKMNDSSPGIGKKLLFWRK